MFTELNERLFEAKEKKRKKVKYEEHIARSDAYLEEEKDKANHLYLQLKKEKKDVSRLEKISLTNIFFTIMGKKLERLDKEQQEVIAAELKYKEAAETIIDLENELKELRTMLQTVVNAEVEYKSLLDEKERLIHDKHSALSRELYDLSEQETSIRSYVKEYEEAIQAGLASLSALQRAIHSLDKAKGWSTWDMFGGGMLTTAIKHSHLDDARKQIHYAQNQLRLFQEELLDIENHFEIKMEIGNFLTFADYFFDGIIVDWVVHGKINDSLSQAEETTAKVREILSVLDEHKNQLIDDYDEIVRKRKERLESA
ncbi:hypothetical protein [Alkalihalobacterium chitinilyticum]|uniref:Uncharacterized protein n=1 Tax=Alkalihalobacterium chitinilyticum TaxID=2980103 RepID=A0ABT5VJ78_9BACI|nr:hypothetical protein [Alkalihalobacterium chitinilyticum]MDE5415510.1 hypothetical protein [Alkalihalobacterium chitinilyticum]